MVAFVTAIVSILMLPLDVANRGSSKGIPMDVLWLAIYITIGVLTVILIPFCYFLYENWDPDTGYVQDYFLK